MRVDAYPMFRRLVIRIADTIVLSFEIVYPFRLTSTRALNKFLDTNLEIIKTCIISNCGEFAIIVE